MFRSSRGVRYVSGMRSSAKHSPSLAFSQVIVEKMPQLRVDAFLEFIDTCLDAMGKQLG